jgi:hypothetical protein
MVEADALYHTAGNKGQAAQGSTKHLGRRARGRRKKYERWEPSNFFAIRLRCQVRMVSGFTIVATSARVCLPSCLPIPTRVFR